MIRARKLVLFMAAVLVCIAFLGTSPQANADFTLTIKEEGVGGSTVVIHDNDPGLDSDSKSGRIVYSGATSSFDIQISVGTSNSPGTPNLAQLTINNTSISSAGFTGTK